MPNPGALNSALNMPRKSREIRQILDAGINPQVSTLNSALNMPRKSQEIRQILDAGINPQVWIYGRGFFAVGHFAVGQFAVRKKMLVTV